VSREEVRLGGVEDTRRFAIKSEKTERGDLRCLHCLLGEGLDLSDSSRSTVLERDAIEALREVDSLLTDNNVLARWPPLSLLLGTGLDHFSCCMCD